ncbi:LOW QUALITY PROTEIN: nose resistant to fluoxetine protein 6-like [Lycorma delicatula]|uniref:LOW QUALITY PROTEIN: nose resistant to fluoxetine protein 6-like n=1 Tax=Lycorma delicatula TaxID=130591 RepID=UPI003F51831B
MQPYTVIDSSGKVPSGLLTGHFNDLGNYEECIQTSKQAPYPVQHCVIQFGNIIRMPKKPVDWEQLESISGGVPIWKPRINIGFCVPASCSLNDLKYHYTTLVKEFNFTVHINEYSCTASNEYHPYTWVDWFGTIILSSMTAIVSISTAIDYFTRDNSKSSLRMIIKLFSAFNNGKKIIKTKNPEQPLTVLNGIRFLSGLWIMLSHHYLFTSFYLRLYGAIILNGILAVDNFIMLNGVLLSYYFIQHQKHGTRFSLLKFYLYRFIRVLPPYIASILAAITIFPRYTGDGPLWKYYIYREKNICLSNWWKNLLFVHNYVTADQQCIPSTWYLSVDMQLYVISPILLFAIVKWKGFVKYMIPTLIVIAILITTLNSYINEIPAGSVIARDYRTHLKHSTEYVTTHTKFSQWLVGIGLGFVLQNVEKDIKVKLFIGWFFSIIGSTAVLFGISYYHQDDIPYNSISSSLYTGLSSFIWAISLGWVIFNCEIGRGGPVHTFLSWRLFQPLAKLTFIMYLTHVGLQYSVLGNHKISPNIEISTTILDAAGEIIITIIIAPIFCLIFEAPYISLEKYFCMTKVQLLSDKPEVKERKTTIMLKETKEKPENCLIAT